MWFDILKTRRKKKINMDHLRKIVDHLLSEMPPDEEFSIRDFEKMVVSTYKHYNPTQRQMNLKSILGNMLQNRGYASFSKSNKGATTIHYRRV
jgi:hypothetical protein